MKVIKSNETLVRETVDKKRCVVIFGVEEDKTPSKMEREKNLKKLVNNIIDVVQEEGKDLVQEIEDFHRIGKFTRDGMRPIRIKFKSQKDVDELVEKSWRLAQQETTKKIWLRRDLSEKEREMLNELRKEALKKK